jgi:hypothetical protein
MPKIVDQGDCLAQILVQPERSANRAGDLGAFQAMGQSIPVMIAFVVHEDLRLVLKASECR